MVSSEPALVRAAIAPLGALSLFGRPVGRVVGRPWELGVIARVIVCAIRNMAPDLSMEAAELAVGFRNHGVVGFDLAGGELGHPAALHAQAFRYAREHDLNCTCHAGEGDGSGSVRGKS